MKTRILILLSCFLTVMVNISSFGQLPSITDAYRKAAQAYREAAGKTNCPDRRKVLLEYAQYQDRLGDYMANSSRNPNAIQPTEPTTRIPDCAADMAGAGEGASRGQSTSGGGLNNSSGRGSSSSSGGSTNNNINYNTIQSTYENSKNSGKKESGALFDAFIAGAQAAPDAETKKLLTGAGIVLGGASAIAERANEKSKKKKMAAYEKQKELENSQNPQFAAPETQYDGTSSQSYSSASSLNSTYTTPKRELSQAEILEIDSRLRVLKSEIANEIAGSVLSRTVWGLMGIAGITIFAASVSDMQASDAVYGAIAGGVIGIYGVYRVTSKNKKLRGFRQERNDLLRAKQGLAFRFTPFHNQMLGQNTFGVRLRVNF